MVRRLRMGDGSSLPTVARYRAKLLVAKLLVAKLLVAKLLVTKGAASDDGSDDGSRADDARPGSGAASGAGCTQVSPSRSGRSSWLTLGSAA